MKVPRKGVRSPPRFELSGSEPSDEPQSRSVNSPEKATPTPRATEWAAITTAAKPRVVVEGMRKATSTDESDGALLRRGMPGGAEAVVKVITPSPERRRLLAARMRRHPLRYAANARSGRVAGLRPLPLWVPRRSIYSTIAWWTCKATSRSTTTAIPYPTTSSDAASKCGRPKST